MSDGSIRWGRVIGFAFLLELALGVTLIPIQPLFGDTPFLIAVPIGCLFLGMLFGWLAARKVQSGFVLHGTLVGLVATVIYLGLVSLAPGSLPAAVAVYGLPLFIIVNALRLVGCIVGGNLAAGKSAA